MKNPKTKKTAEEPLEESLEIYQRKSICQTSTEGFVEVSEWYSGEGFDVLIESKETSERFSLKYSDFNNLKKLVTKLKKEIV